MMIIEWRDQYAGQTGIGSVCEYHIEDPDSLGKSEIRAKVIGDPDVPSNWHFVGYKSGESAAKSSAQKHEDSMAAYLNTSMEGE